MLRRWLLRLLCAASAVERSEIDIHRPQALGAHACGWVEGHDVGGYSTCALDILIPRALLKLESANHITLKAGECTHPIDVAAQALHWYKSISAVLSTP